MKTIEEEWIGFSTMIFAKMNPPPGQTQIKETKQAFFAGYWSLLCTMERIGEADVTEDDGAAFLEARKQEGQQFYSDLIKRYAEGN